MAVKFQLVVCFTALLAVCGGAFGNKIDEPSLSRGYGVNRPRHPMARRQQMFFQNTTTPIITTTTTLEIPATSLGPSSIPEQHVTSTTLHGDSSSSATTGHALSSSIAPKPSPLESDLISESIRDGVTSTTSAMPSPAVSTTSIIPEQQSHGTISSVFPTLTQSATPSQQTSKSAIAIVSEQVPSSEGHVSSLATTWTSSGSAQTATLKPISTSTIVQEPLSVATSSIFLKSASSSSIDASPKPTAIPLPSLTEEGLSTLAQVISSMAASSVSVVLMPSARSETSLLPAETSLSSWSRDEQSTSAQAVPVATSSVSVVSLSSFKSEISLVPSATAVAPSSREDQSSSAQGTVSVATSGGSIASLSSFLTEIPQLPSATLVASSSPEGSSSSAQGIVPVATSSKPIASLSSFLTETPQLPSATSVLQSGSAQETLPEATSSGSWASMSSVTTDSLSMPSATLPLSSDRNQQSSSAQIGEPDASLSGSSTPTPTPTSAIAPSTAQGTSSLVVPISASEQSLSAPLAIDTLLSTATLSVISTPTSTPFSAIAPSSTAQGTDSLVVLTSASGQSLSTPSPVGTLSSIAGSTLTLTPTLNVQPTVSTSQASSSQTAVQSSSPNMLVPASSASDSALLQSSVTTLSVNAASTMSAVPISGVLTSFMSTATSATYIATPSNLVSGVPIESNSTTNSIALASSTIIETSSIAVGTTTSGALSSATSVSFIVTMITPIGSSAAIASSATPLPINSIAPGNSSTAALDTFASSFTTFTGPASTLSGLLTSQSSSTLPLEPAMNSNSTMSVSVSGVASSGQSVLSSAVLASQTTTNPTYTTTSPLSGVSTLPTLSGMSYSSASGSGISKGPTVTGNFSSATAAQSFSDASATLSNQASQTSILITNSGSSATHSASDVGATAVLSGASSALNYTAARTTSATLSTESQPLSDSQHATLTQIPTTAAGFNITATATSFAASKTTTDTAFLGVTLSRFTYNSSIATTVPLVSETSASHGRGNETSFLGATPSRSMFSGSVVPTGSTVDYNGTRLATPQATSLPVWSQSTIVYPDINATMSVNFTVETDSFKPTTSVDVGSKSTSATDGSGRGAWRTVSTLFAATASSTGTAVATPLPPPPLTKPQTVGVAVAGVTGLLIAVVAAVYIARRYYAMQARRTSSGSIYPKVAYLYDPPAGGNGDGGSSEAIMSGGASGMPSDPRNSIASQRAQPPSFRHSTGSLPLRFSDPGNPFRDPENHDTYSRGSTGSTIRAPADAAAALSAAVAGYKATSPKSPGTVEFPTPKQSLEYDMVSPTLSRSSILGEIASMAYNPYTVPNAGSQYRLLPPYARQQNYSMPSLRESCATDPFADPFEHDVLLRVDARSETPDAVTVYAPPPTLAAPSRTITPIMIPAKKTSSRSLLSPVAAQALNKSASRQPDERVKSPKPASSPNERFSLVYDNTSSTTYLAPARTQPAPIIPPASPPHEPMHRGWDDIKRYSDDKVVPPTIPVSPSMINLRSPSPSFSPPPSKMRSLPQLRRKEPALAGNGQAMLSTARLPLTVKIPFTHHNKSSSILDVPRLSYLKTTERGEDSARSHEGVVAHGVHSLASMMHHKKKSNGNMEFSCAGV